MPHDVHLRDGAVGEAYRLAVERDDPALIDLLARELRLGLLAALARLHLLRGHHAGDCLLSRHAGRSPLSGATISAAIPATSATGVAITAGSPTTTMRRW